MDKRKWRRKEWNKGLSWKKRRIRRRKWNKWISVGKREKERGRKKEGRN